MKKVLMTVAAVIALILLAATPVAAEEVSEAERDGSNGIVVFFKENAPTVLSTVTLIVSVAGVFLTKSGLMPYIQQAFASSFKKQEESEKALGASADKSLAVAENTNALIAQAKTELTKATEAAYEQAQRYAELRVKLLKQEAANKAQAQMTKEVADMVYAIVLASSAPEYVREMVVKAHEAIVAQNAAIETGEAPAGEV